MSYYGWENEALPLGNGKIGAKVFGGMECELIHFNEKTLWSGGKDVPGYNGGISNPDKGAGMREIQKLLSKGDRKSATEKRKDAAGMAASLDFIGGIRSCRAGAGCPG